MKELQDVSLPVTHVLSAGLWVHAHQPKGVRTKKRGSGPDCSSHLSHKPFSKGCCFRQGISLVASPLREKSRELKESWRVKRKGWWIRRHKDFNDEKRRSSWSLNPFRIPLSHKNVHSYKAFRAWNQSNRCDRWRRANAAEKIAADNAALPFV